MKEPEYVMKTAAPYAGLMEKDGQRESKRIYIKNVERKSIKFKYKEPFLTNFIIAT